MRSAAKKPSIEAKPDQVTNSFNRESLRFANQHQAASHLDTRQILPPRTPTISTLHFVATDASMTTRRTPLMDISNNDVTSSPAATDGSRRKSGRAVRAPEKFVPSSSEPAATSAKRKRGGDEVENDASDIDDEDEADATDVTLESADEEELRETRKKAKTPKKPVAKKPKVNGTAPHKPAPAVKIPNRTKKAKKVVINDDTAEGLYGERVFKRGLRNIADKHLAEVFTSGDTLEDVASVWLARFKEGNLPAMAELVNFILRCAGCPLQITADDIDDEDNVANRLGDLQEEYQAVI